MPGVGLYLSGKVGREVELTPPVALSGATQPLLSARTQPDRDVQAVTTPGVAREEVASFQDDEAA